MTSEPSCSFCPADTKILMLFFPVPCIARQSFGRAWNSRSLQIPWVEVPLAPFKLQRLAVRIVRIVHIVFPYPIGCCRCFAHFRTGILRGIHKILPMCAAFHVQPVKPRTEPPTDRGPLLVHCWSTAGPLLVHC